MIENLIRKISSTSHSVIRIFRNSVISHSVICKARQGFTLVEVNLAMLIMAGGILSIVGLYAFGFRENRQGREDVAAAAFADAVISPLVMALSATNVTWSAFNSLQNYPSDEGWGYYFDDNGVVKQDPESTAEGVFSRVMGAVNANDVDTEFPTAVKNDAKMSCGLVVRHPRDSAVVSIGFRAVREGKHTTLLSMPLFYTEVRFQGTVE